MIQANGISLDSLGLTLQVRSLFSLTKNSVGAGGVILLVLILLIVIIVCAVKRKQKKKNSEYYGGGDYSKENTRESDVSFPIKTNLILKAWKSYPNDEP